MSHSQAKLTPTEQVEAQLVDRTVSIEDPTVADHSELAQEENPVGHSKAAVLVVEDEPLLRWFAVDMIEDAGFEAVEAGGSSEAMRILEGRFDIRIVFTDIDMPGGVDGLELAAMVRDRWPPIEIIVTSGKQAPMEDEMPPGGLFFAKPYRPEEVIAAMRRMTL
jgi:DNA-binding NtrC family response regulator